MAFGEDEPNSEGQRQAAAPSPRAGGSWCSWRPVLDDLAAERQVIAIDLPGFGRTPALTGQVSIATLAAAVTEFLGAHKLLGVDVVGSSMGARLALELARRGVVGATIALDPGGSWRGWERNFFYTSIAISVRLVRLHSRLCLCSPGTPWVALCF